MSAFEDFVQTELPKRPFTEADTAAETLLVRRGVGPRQHVELILGEGEVPLFTGGTLTAATVEAGLECVDAGNY